MRFRRKPRTGDEIMVPLKFVEATRLSLITIGSHADVSDGLKLYITTWLANFSGHLSMWLETHYGKDIFDLANQVTDELTPGKTTDPAWDAWEAQFKDGEQA